VIEQTLSLDIPGCKCTHSQRRVKINTHATHTHQYMLFSVALRVRRHLYVLFTASQGHLGRNGGQQYEWRTVNSWCSQHHVCWLSINKRVETDTLCAYIMIHHITDGHSTTIPSNRQHCCSSQQANTNNPHHTPHDSHPVFSPTQRHPITVAEPHPAIIRDCLRVSPSWSVRRVDSRSVVSVVVRVW